MTKTTKKQSFVWKATRFGFCAMIACWIIAVITSMGETSALFALGWIGITIFTFVNSIVHLTKHKKKAFAVISLVLSSWLVLTFTIGFALTFMGVIA